MATIIKQAWLLNLVFLFIPFSGYSQQLSEIGIISTSGLKTDKFVLSDSSKILLADQKPLYSFLLDGKQYNSGESEAILINDKYVQTFNNYLTVTYINSGHYATGCKAEITFENVGKDTISISNVLPLGPDTNSVRITGMGPIRSGACMVIPTRISACKGHSS